MPKFRARFERQAAVMWISHLNIMKALQQALRRSGLVAATRGTFNPHVKLAVAVPLPVGVTSEAEYLEVELVEPVKGEEFKERMNRNLPPGLKLLAVTEAPAGAPPLASRINAADYVLKVRAEAIGSVKTAGVAEAAEATGPVGAAQASPGPIPAGSERFWEEIVRDLLGRESLRVVRNTPRGSREIDLRPLIFGVSLIHTANGAASIFAAVSVAPGGTVRPEEIVSVLGVGGVSLQLEGAHRQSLYVYVEGRKLDPLHVDAG